MDLGNGQKLIVLSLALMLLLVLVGFLIYNMSGYFEAHTFIPDRRQINL